MKTQITNAGIDALLNAGLNGPKVNVTKVKIGSAVITPSATMTDVVDKVWEGGSEYIQYQVLDSRNFMFKITLDESVGDFKIGNIGLFLEDGTMFTITALLTQVAKLKNDPPQVGNRHIFAIPITLSGVSGLINVSVIIPDESSIPFVQTEADLPPVNNAAYSVYEVMYHSILQTPCLALRTLMSGWLYIKAQTGEEGGGFPPSMFEDGCLPGTALYFDATDNLFKPADGLNPNKGYLGIMGSMFNVVSDGAFYSGQWNLVPGANYYADGGENKGRLTATPNNFYVGKAINEHTLLLGNLTESVVNKVNTVSPTDPKAYHYPTELAVVNYVTNVRNDIMTEVGAIRDTLQADINTRAKADMSNVGDVTFSGNVTFSNTINGTARAALWSE